MTDALPDASAPLRMRAMAFGLRSQQLCLLHQDQTNTFDLAENLPPLWPTADIEGLGETAGLPAPLAPRFSAARSHAHQSGEAVQVEFALGEGQAKRDYHAEFHKDGGGTLIVIADITALRSRDRALKTLLREVSHRSKNLLAIVQSVAMQTAQHSDTIQNFLDRFRGRLHALSSAQDLVTDTNWQGTDLHALISAQLSRIGRNMADRVAIVGLNPLLTPNAALHIGLAIHELATNASRYGALSLPTGGDASIAARLDADAGKLTIEWQESRSARNDNTGTARFGSLVLTRVVPLSVGGAASLAITDDGVRYTLSVPKDQFSI